MPHNTFYDTDIGMPSITESAGTFIALLTQVLVTGGGNIALSSVTLSGSVATYTSTANHQLSPTSAYPISRRLTISGWTQPEYNGEFVVTVTGPTTFTATVTGTPTTPGTGTGTCKLTGLGWTKPFTTTNQCCFKAGAGSNGYYLQMNDTFGADYAQVRGYETMTSATAGSNLFPTTAQVAAGLFNWHKPPSGSGATMKWVISGNSKCFHMFGATAADLATYGMWHVTFGDQLTEVTGDSYATFIDAVSATSATQSYQGNPKVLQPSTSTLNTGTAYMARSSTGTAGAINVGTHSDYAKLGGSQSGGTGGLQYPALNGGMYLAPEVVHHNNSPRAVMPGIYVVCHARPIGHLDYFTGTGIYAGKTFQNIWTTQGGSGGCTVIEVTPW